MNKPILIRANSVLIAAVLATAVWVSAGSLTPPPGPVSPTMKTLVDVEPRTAIRNDPNFMTPIVINFPGSYYLAEDVQALFGQHGITIDASHVTLDLNGYTVYGNLEVGSLDGIHLNFDRDNITIKNGTVRDFFQNGIAGQLSDGCVIEDVRVINNGGHGIVVQEFARIKDCMALNNRDNGIYIARNGVITGCMAVNNGSVNGESGIRVALEGGLVFASMGNRNSGLGIWLGDGGLASASMARGNVNNIGFMGSTQLFVHGSTSTENGNNGVNGTDIDCYIGP